MARLPWMRGLIAALGTLVSLAHGHLRFDVEAARKNPITRVVGLLEDMEKQIEVDGKKDEEAYEKVVCWCTSTKKAKTLAIEEGAARIDALTSEIEQGIALSARLGPEIEALKNEVVRNSGALRQAVTIREKQEKEFEAESEDLRGSISALKQAMIVIGKEDAGLAPGPAPAPAATSMLQVSSKSMNSALRRALGHRPKLLDEVLSRVAQGKSKSFLQAGYDPGAASSEVRGMLTGMLTSFSDNLKEMIEEEKASKETFAKLKQAKTEELEGGNAQVVVKEKEKADADEKLAYDRKDKKTAIENWNSDKKFLAAVETRCTKSELEWNTRQKERREEIQAINEATNVLEGGVDLNAASPAPAPAPSFLQSQLRMSRRQEAARVLSTLATRQQDSRLSALAMRAKIDSLTEVTKAIDGMIKELKEQKSDELKKNDFCTSQLHQNQMQQEKKDREKQDVDILLDNLAETTKKASEEKKELEGQIEEMKTELLKAAEEREGQNKAFQLSINDQRQTQRLLQAALKVLTDYYKSKGSFVQEPSAPEKEGTPDLSIAPSGPAQKYEKSSGAKGVMQLLEFIIEQSKAAEQEAIKDESEAQTDYEGTVADTTASIKDKEKEIQNRKVVLSKAEGDTADAKTDDTNIMTAKKELVKSAGTLHSDCDFLLKNFQMRQEAFDDEVSALIEAKGLMSGISGAPLGSSPAPAPSS
eukprot:TRINITY_DN42409_c0_g1_i1.p1 TRINITY_DN42409_c0_g1~~TRINITY_DN42409_c0_g1_i1.p1  ORF type:complete len:703 (+),score=218.86 TRINITY_DN42409_c0_g1_i1:71-2179(+)